MKDDDNVLSPYEAIRKDLPESLANFITKEVNNKIMTTGFIYNPKVR